MKRETYDKLLKTADWLVILDQSLKSWDISLRTASEKLFYRENDYRSVGIYSANCNKFILGYDTLVKQLGNFIPQNAGIKEVIEAVRSINDDGLLSIVSHASNKIFDEKHGKGSLGTALAAIHYKRENPNSILVGLDTQLAQEWLSDREEGELPDLVAINLFEDRAALVDIIEVKTYADSPNSFQIKDNHITGHAVEQVTVLEKLIHEMFSATERITTVSRREILREQVFECLFHANIEATRKLRLCDELNALFAGEFKVKVKKNIAFVDFENAESSQDEYGGLGEFIGNKYLLTTIGSTEIQSILANIAFEAQLVEDDPAIVAVESMHGETNSLALSSGIPEKEQNSNVDVSNFATENVYENEESRARIAEKCAKLNRVFRNYGIRAEPIDLDMVQESARFTRFPVKLKSGETINNLNKYRNDIGIQLEASGEILVEHIKGTSYISVDVPFAGAGSSISLMKHLSKLDGAKGRLNVIAGQKPDGNFEIRDIADAPHMLIAGTTGSGKTIFLQN